MIRTIDVREISKNIKEMCIEANHYLSKDMDTAINRRSRMKNHRLENRYWDSCRKI